MMMMLLKIIDQAIGEFGKTDLEQTSFLIIQIVQITWSFCHPIWWDHVGKGGKLARTKPFFIRME